MTSHAPFPLPLRRVRPPIPMCRLLGFAGTLLLPIDIAQATTHLNMTAVNEGIVDRSPVLEGFWAFVYWTTFMLTWVVLPLLQARGLTGGLRPRARRF